MFFITNCTGQVVGNKAGYATMKGAVAQQNKQGSKAYKALWKAFDSVVNAPSGFRPFSKIVTK